MSSWSLAMCTTLCRFALLTSFCFLFLFTVTTFFLTKRFIATAVNEQNVGSAQNQLKLCQASLPCAGSQQSRRDPRVSITSLATVCAREGSYRIYVQSTELFSHMKLELLK